MLQTKKIEYYDNETLLEGYFAYNDNSQHSVPTILIFHDWTGRNDFACQKAEKLAELGYAAFAVDMYGKGKLGKTTEEKMALITPFKEDRKLLLKRALSAFETIEKNKVVNTAKMGAMGFCFGGLCALDLARSGAELRGVVSFHGLLDRPTHLKQETIRAKILALHGHDDPMVPPDQVLAFENEMTEQKVDWQLHVYGNTKHAFTNPNANDNNLGTVYNALAEKRSWIAMKNFWEEIF